MEERPFKFHFPPDIKLNRNPLLEAWLEIRWQLVSGDVANFMRDPGFPFALGAFYHSIKNEFGYREDLDASRIPEEMFPHVVRHRFRPGENEWPLLQLGPGVATVNFTDPYNWDDFLNRALYLREKLVDAYSDMELKTQMVNLRYRNGVSFEYSSVNLLNFLKQNLNTSIMFPDHVPGAVSSVTWPTSINVVSTFDLSKPKGLGRLRFNTGVRTQRDSETNQETKEEMIIWELNVESKENNAPDINEKDKFTTWLTSAHSVIHEWFFSLIDGPLYRKYKGEVE